MEVRSIGIQSVDVTLRNKPGSLLVVHAFAEKAKAEIRAKQQKQAKKAKAERVPADESEAAKYIDTQGRECVPITAIKKSMITAVTALDGLTKVALRQAIFVDCVATPGAALVPIELHNGKPAVGTMREDAVTIGNGIRGLTYRPEYPEWQIRVRVEFNSRLVSLDQIFALIDHAGWGVGICEGRPERTSALGWGRFERVI